MNIVDIMETPRIYTAIAEWAGCLVYILLFKKELSKPKLISALAGGFLLLSGYQFFAGHFPLYFWIPGMIFAIVLMYFFIYTLCDISLADAGFCCVRAFVFAEFAASLQQQLFVWIIDTYHTKGEITSILVMATIYTLLFAGYFYMEQTHIPQEIRLDVTSSEFFSTFMIGFGVFLISNLSFVMPNTPFSAASTSLLYVRTLVDFSGILMLYAQQDKREEFRMRTENESMNNVLQRQYDQFRVAQDNMEILHREFHDLKHYMIALRAENDPEKKEHYLSEMEQAIHVQEAYANTGNHVLDVVLTTKGTYCTQKKITFNCMADGTLLNFIHVKDICSIFGNALDNAIECVQQFSDPEKRFISLSVMRKNNFIIVECVNYTNNLIEKKGVLPKTTKNNTQFHGYGLKSIQAAAHKYNGSMTLHSDHNWFTLQILLPLPQER